MTKKRNLLAVWLVLLGINFAIISQNWYVVSYQFDGTVKHLSVSGIAAWTLVNAAQILGFISLAAVALSRGAVRLVLTWLTLVTQILLFTQNLATLTVKVPPLVNGMVETASGVSGGSSKSISEAIIEVQQSVGLAFGFVACMALILAVHLVAAINSPRWATIETADRFAKTVAVKPSAGRKASSESTETTADTKGSNISLWDSQR